MNLPGPLIQEMSSYKQPVVDSTSVFKPDIFNGKVLFCTGGGSGICRAMTEAVVSSALELLTNRRRNEVSLDAPWCQRYNSRSKVCAHSHIIGFVLLIDASRLDRLTQAAKELSEATGQKCIPCQGDVRQPKTLHDAVAITIQTFGKIDFVICGKYAKVSPYLPEHSN